MATMPTERFLQRLPQFITLFFSITLVHGFRIFAETFNWSTGPIFNVYDLSQVMLAISFFLTLFWVVTAWLGYSLLIERYPYDLNFYRFFFDVARFVIMFALVHFSFLAAQPGTYHNFVFTLALFHLMMTGWHISQLQNAANIEQQRERKADVKGHAFRFGSYLVIGSIYYLVVVVLAGPTVAEAVHFAAVITTLIAMTAWNVKRLAELKNYALKEMPGNVQTAGSPR